ncbi:peptidase inhibitor family I36 protein [Nonomuraea typhae]|uniref:Peptidase inhibitor family I36 protein n=1 Tax=Nonomuraea typhae TaxID=2603600 RepID=A0ABW7ZD44_9ACTN
MSIRRSLRRACAPVLLGALLLSFLPGTAHAAGITDCPRGSICGWSGERYTGTMTQLRAGAGCVQTPFPIRSAANTFGPIGIPAVAIFYALPGCAGPSVGSVGQSSSLPVVSPPAISAMLVW